MALEELFHIKQRLGAVQADGDENSGRVQFRLDFPADSNADQRHTGRGRLPAAIGAAPWDFPAGPSLDKNNDGGRGFTGRSSSLPSSPRGSTNTSTRCRSPMAPCEGD